MSSNNDTNRRTFLKTGAATGTTIVSGVAIGSASAASYEHKLEVKPESDAPGDFRALVVDITDFETGARLPNPRDDPDNGSRTVRFEATVEEDSGWFDRANTYSYLEFDSDSNELYIQENDSNVTAYIDGDIITTNNGTHYY